MASIARWTIKNDNRYTAFDGRLYLERRPKLSPNWTARCCHANQQLYKTTKTLTLPDAQQIAEDWFLGIQARIKKGEPVKEQTLEDAYKSFIYYQEHDALHTGASNLRKIADYKTTWNRGAKEFLGQLRLSEVTTKKLEAFRLWRQERSKALRKQPLTEKTIHGDMVLVRMCLKEAIRQEWLKYLPQFPVEHIEHESPDWFNQDELAKLIAVSADRMMAKDTGNAAKRIRVERTELHAFIWLMAHGCIRVNEAWALKWNQIVPHPDNAKVPPDRRQYLLRIRVGKTKWRQGIGTLGVAIAMQYLRALHPDAKPEDNLFSSKHPRAFPELLKAADLYWDDRGKRRSTKTLRHTSIMLRFLHEPGISAFELATISGNSVTTLENYYLRHLTGSHVSDRLMKKAMEEFSGVKGAKSDITWLREQVNIGALDNGDPYGGEDQETWELETMPEPTSDMDAAPEGDISTGLPRTNDVTDLAADEQSSTQFARPKLRVGARASKKR